MLEEEWQKRHDEEQGRNKQNLALRSTKLRVAEKICESTRETG